MKFSILLIVCISGVTSYRNYEGYSVYKVIPKTENELSVLRDLEKNRIGQFWDPFYMNYEARLMVPEENKSKFLSLTQTAGIEANVTIEDLQRAIIDQLRFVEPTVNSSFLSLNWNQYHNLEEIYRWLDEIETNYPGIASTVVMGRSVEGRVIKGIKINYNPNRENKQIGMLQATIHAGEWITTTTLTWIIKEFLTSQDPDVRIMAENIEWHLFPVVNPDGYVYTFSTDRIWRKNRSKNYFKTCSQYGLPDDLSNGVDLNRNFDFVWMSVGASDEPCTITYAGPSAFSEPESKAIAQYVLNLNNQGRFLYFMDFHSYTQLIVIPFSHVNSTDEMKASNYEDMYEIAAKGAAQVEKRFGTHYRYGLSANILYPMSGTNFDWVKNATNVPISFLIEFRDLGEYGFLLPPNQIIPNSLEFMDALIEMDRTTRKLGYYSKGNAMEFSCSVILFMILIDLSYKNYVA